MEARRTSRICAKQRLRPARRATERIHGWQEGASRQGHLAVYRRPLDRSGGSRRWRGGLVAGATAGLRAQARTEPGFADVSDRSSWTARLAKTELPPSA